MRQTTLEETKLLNASGNFQRLPVFREIFSDIRTPVETLDEMERLLEDGTPAKLEPGRLISEFRQAFSKEEYCRKVERVKIHIRGGDIFQLVLVNPMEADFAGSLLNTYRVLPAGTLSGAPKIRACEIIHELEGRNRGIDHTPE